MKRFWPMCAFWLIWTCICVFSCVAADPAGSGIVTGRVTHAETGGTLPGANVTIEGTLLGDITDSAGRFRIVGVPEGRQRLGVSYLGYPARKRPRLSLSTGRQPPQGLWLFR